MEIGTLIRELGGGMWISAEIFILTLLFSLPLGLVVAFGRMSKIAPVRWISKLYISIMRGTPLMLQLMVVYFGPYYLFGMRISTGYRMTAVLIGFAINYAAYFAEAELKQFRWDSMKRQRCLGIRKVRHFSVLYFHRCVNIFCLP